MILSGETIKRLGLVTPHHPRIKYEGMTYGQGPSGYDVRLRGAVTLVPGRTVLGVSFEHMALPNNVIARIGTKSTWARIGVTHIGNTKADAGWRGYLTFELVWFPLEDDDRTELHINALMPIAEIEFQFVDEMTEGYGDGKYQDQPAVPTPAIFDWCSATTLRRNEMLNLRSFWLGIRSMTRDRGAVNVSIQFGLFGWWLHLWTPIWHEGRGPYISCGLGVIRILRGY